MTFENALDKVVRFLKENHGATNKALTELIDGDTGLFDKVREHLIFNDMAEDKKGVGLIYIMQEDKTTGKDESVVHCKGEGEQETIKKSTSKQISAERWFC